MSTKDSSTGSSSRRTEQEPDDVNVVLGSLLEHNVTAAVKDMDHYRQERSVLAIKTDYIIHVKGTYEGEDFGYIISKDFTSFRTLANNLNLEAEDATSLSVELPKKVTALAKKCHNAFGFFESQQTEYVGKVSYTYVKSLSKQRSQIINQFLEGILSSFPSDEDIETFPFARRIALILEKFFLSDQVKMVEGEGEEDKFGLFAKNSIRKNYKASDGIPVAIKTRKSKESRKREEKELEKSAMYLEESQTNQKKASPPTLGKFIDEQPLMAWAAFGGAMLVLRRIGNPSITMDLDILLLLGFGLFFLGLNFPSIMGTDQKKATVATHTAMSRRASIAGSLEDAPPPTIESPMARFPEGAKLGTVFNAMSDPPSTVFNVRGANYLNDKKKIQSGPFLLPTRGVDLLLTDQMPENVGRVTSLMAGELRSVPTFIINFRLPWGVLLFYFEIPERFIPYVKGCYGDSEMSKTDLEAQINKMESNSDRCAARFLLGDDAHKNGTLKIFPAVVEGPWVVKATVGGRPAIIGNKLPVNYVYGPEKTAADGSKQCMYLEADLDICSSSAARSILSVVRSSTQDLTLDLGFGVQGNSDDELPEQMMTGTRLHGIDPLNAPSFPPTDMLFGEEPDLNDEDED